MESTLSAGAVQKMMSKEVVSEQQMMPVLQVTELKVVLSIQEPMKERFRMVLSDGTHLHHAMLHTTQNQLVKEEILQVGSIVRLTRFMCNEIQKRSVVIVVVLEVLTTRSEIIGRPIMGGMTNDQRGADSGNHSNTTGFEKQGHVAMSPQVGQRQVFGNGCTLPASVPSARAYNRCFMCIFTFCSRCFGFNFQKF